VSINRLVGERVFGWAVRESEDEPATWGTRRITRLDCQYHGTTIDSGPHFDREIAAAWEVVEHVTGPNFNNRAFVLTLQEEYGWECTIGAQDGDDRGCIYSTHKEAPMAICLAALRAVGVPEATIQEACK